MRARTDVHTKMEELPALVRRGPRQGGVHQRLDVPLCHEPSGRSDRHRQHLRARRLGHERRGNDTRGAYPNRFVLGGGVSHGPMVEIRGHDYKSPLSTMRSYLKDMRQARYEAVPPEHDPPWILAALGPRMLELSRDLADGAHPYLVTPQHTAGAREILGEGPLLVVEQAVAPTSEREEALRLARSHLSPYMRLPNYRNSWLRQGFGEEDLSGDGSDRLAEGLVAWGSESDIHKRVSEHFSVGADQVLVQVLVQVLRDGPAEGLWELWRYLTPVLLG
jgi:probable F420-dependent oxidoreductase